MGDLQQYDKFTATFTPVRADDLKPGLVDLIGNAYEWMVIGEVDEGPYAGQWMCSHFLSMAEFPAAWVPMCDLTVVNA